MGINDARVVYDNMRVRRSNTRKSAGTYTVVVLCTRTCKNRDNVIAEVEQKPTEP